MKYTELLTNLPLFHGVNDGQLDSLLHCLQAKLVAYEKNTTIFLSGDPANKVGIVCRGQAQVIKESFYGNASILSDIRTGEMFGETFACAKVDTLPVSVIATEKSEILLLNYRKIITVCSSACAFHSLLVSNMLQIIARKTLMLNKKISMLSARTTREKLLLFLSEQAEQQQNKEFSIPFNRQQLADFLSVDRSAMSTELGKLRDEGLLIFSKNQFTLADDFFTYI